MKPFDNKKDYCTFFPEEWRGVSIKDCCFGHDSTCSTRLFYLCLEEKVGKFWATLIAFGGSVGFGKYEWNRKLRTSNGDSGVQLAWTVRADGSTKYMFSVASQKLPLINKPFTMFYGNNLDYNGRFSVAIKFK